MTLGIDIGFVKLILAHAAAVHGLPVKVEPVDLARIALKRLRVVGKAISATGARRRMNSTGSSVTSCHHDDVSDSPFRWTRCHPMI
ncbi:hypothetical protein [Mesorhizobium sp. LNJC405B00]|uniref:hypothetical protein n=1 Tax=unclassified Mesorhizobium TaxID=325217 RepID=UPI000A6F755B|nr:hypothetical protein [Mesorhizobium sp. LNJC405B00]